jgi:leucyl aminopeptidase (aminopeptidase T)
MREANVVLAITNQSSMSHTDARENASRAGARIATALFPEMFELGGPMDVDYLKVSDETKGIAERITAAQTATVRSAAGTDITFSVAGRSGQVDDGLYCDSGRWGNLPSGEAYTAPLEGTAEGQMVVEPGWARDLTTPLVLRFKDGSVIAIEGGGKVGDQVRDMLQLERDVPPYKLRRNLAELGVGTNPNARNVNNLVEAEKIKGTVHLAVGDNAHMGGKVSVDYHRDFVIAKATLLLDGIPILQDGRVLIYRMTDMTDFSGYIPLSV